MSEPITTFNKIKPSKTYNLDDCDKQILSEATRRFAVASALEAQLKSNHLADMLAMGYKPPTRWQRFKYRLADLKQRCKDIWTIVSGGDVHENCGY
jgi:hypothetical protein